jgi:two-component system sensor histidine kinase PilS (NtrC family)
MTSQPNRRQADRRKGGDRRGPPKASDGEAWLSAWGDGAGTGSPAASAEPDAGSDSRFIAREALRLVSVDGAALPRILRTYVAARAALGLALGLAPWVASFTVGRTPVPLMVLCLAYAAQAVSLWLLHGAKEDQQTLPDHLQPRQWLWTIGVDLLAFSCLRLLDPVGQLNYTALLVLPVLMSGVLTRRIVALATAAGVTLLLLLGVWPMAREAGDTLVQLSQAGLTGAGLFLITLLASELAQRLAREELAARNSLALARQQTLLNRAVIEEMVEGVLVADRQGRVRAINPAGRALLGVSGAHVVVPFPLADDPGLHGLLRALDQAYVEGAWPAQSREITVNSGEGESRLLQVRARFTRRGGIGLDDAEPEDICVLFLEDMRTVQARARQDKLAAMGRVSADVAHEIRNPLAAIAQANALLMEDLLPPQHQRLVGIVSANVERLKRIVDDVLAVTPGSASVAALVDARAEAQQVVDEWLRGTPSQHDARERLRCDWPNEPLPVMFDAEHLRRVLVNLLDNAMRHASGGAAAVHLRLVSGPRPGRVTLWVASDGAAITPDVERYLFEPFFSTSSRGSGLGLYICRELCERHGARIDFALAPPTSRHRNVFSVVMRSAPQVPPKPAAVPV